MRTDVRFVKDCMTCYLAARSIGLWGVRCCAGALQRVSTTKPTIRDCGWQGAHSGIVGATLPVMKGQRALSTLT